MRFDLQTEGKLDGKYFIRGSWRKMRKSNMAVLANEAILMQEYISEWQTLEGEIVCYMWRLVIQIHLTEIVMEKQKRNAAGLIVRWWQCTISKTEYNYLT